MSQMIEVKTAELSGAALDWAVAKAEGVSVFLSTSNTGTLTCWLSEKPKQQYSPSTRWRQAGPLIENNRIGFGLYPNAYFACTGLNDCGGEASGPTHLIAACRAIVAAKLGDTVAVPAELLS